MYSLSLIVGRSGRAECVPAWLVPFWLCCWGQVCSCCGLPLGSLLVELQVLLGTVCPLFCCVLIKLQVIVGDRVSLCVVGRGSRVSLLLELWCMKWFGVVAIFSKPELFRISLWCWGWTVSKRLSWRNICFVASSIYHLLQIAFIFSVLQWIRLLHLQLYAPKSS